MLITGGLLHLLKYNIEMCSKCIVIYCRPLLHFVCGSAGGCAGTLASFPWDVVRTRLVAQQASVYSGTR